MLDHLTETAIKKAAREAEETKQRRDLSDPQYPGLRLRLAAGGKKSWVLACRDAYGAMRRFPLGAHPRMGIAEARKAAEKMRVDVRNGADPIAHNRRLRQLGKEAKAGIGTLTALLDLYGKMVGADLKSWPECRRRIGSVFYSMLEKPVANLKYSDFQMVADGWKSKQSAAAAVRYLRPVLKWAAKRNYVPREAAEIGPPATVKRRERTLNADELKAILPVFAASSRPAAKAQLFMLLTLGRREEVGAATWGRVDLKAKTWTIPDTKNGKAHRVALSAQALALLESMKPKSKTEGKPAASAKPDALIFATETGNRLMNWDRETKQVQSLSLTKDWTRHDLRRTGATLLGEMGIQPHVIEAALNHTAIHSQLASVYNQSRYQAEVADAMQRLGDRLEGIASGGVDVLPLRRGA